jgi:apolipoprotein N-acyltransferase
MGAAFLLLVFNFLMYKIFIQGGKKYFYNLLVLLLVLFLLKPNYNGEKSEIYLGNFNLGNDFKFLFSAKDFKGLFEKIPNKNDLIFLPENFKLYEDKELFKEFKIIGTESIFQKQIVYRLENREITPLYEKKLLMPMGEYRIEAFNFLFKYIGGDKWQEFFKQSGSGLKSGESVYNSTEYAYLICGDFLSTYLLNASLKGSKEAILLSSSLRPFNQNYNTEEKLKLYYKMRALESGRYLLLAGYNTESLVVNPYGEIEYSFEAGKNSFSLEKVSFKKNKQKTFYQKILDIFL